MQSKHGLPKGILFDLDDTLITLNALAQPLWRRICKRYAPRIGACSPEALYEAIESAGTWYWSDAARHARGRSDFARARREIVGDAFARLDVGNPKLAHEIADTFSRECDAATHCFPGAKETLQYFARRGVRLGLITNGGAEQQRAKIDRFGLAPYFKSICIEGELGFGKPDPRVYAIALRDLGLAPGDVWIVGDNLEWEVAAPQELGIYAIWHDYRGDGLPSDAPAVPDRIVRRVAELIEPQSDYAWRKGSTRSDRLTSQARERP